MAFNKKTHLRQNIDALKTAFTLDRERRAPTPEEERTLGAYSGFGAIKEVPGKPHRETGQGRHGNARGRVARGHQGEHPRRTGIQALHGRDQELRPDGFLHAPKVADAIVEAIWDTRIVPKRILDPSAGTGFLSMPWISTTPTRRSPASRKTPPRG